MLTVLFSGTHRLFLRMTMESDTNVQELCNPKKETQTKKKIPKHSKNWSTEPFVQVVGVHLSHVYSSLAGTESGAI